MAATLQHVQPGDLIRAEFFNAIVDKLEEIDAKLAALDGGPITPGAVRITSVSPKPVHVGEPLTVTGSNFAWSTGAAVVFLDDQLITAFSSGSDSQLVFTVPEFTAVPATGRTIVLAVSNATSTDTETLTLLPRPDGPEGDLSLAYLGATPATPLAGTTLFLEYELGSNASVAVDVNLTAVVSTGWPNVQFLSDLSPVTPIVPPRISIARLEQKTFFLEIPVPAGVPTGTPFDVAVLGAGGGLTVPPVEQSFSIGTAAPQEAAYIKLNAPGGTSISAARNATVAVDLRAEFEQTGTYDIAASFDGPASGWQLDDSDLTSRSPIAIASIPTSGPTPGRAIATFTLALTAPGTLPATQPVRVVIEAQKQGDPLSRTLPLNLTAT